MCKVIGWPEQWHGTCSRSEFVTFVDLALRKAPRLVRYILWIVQEIAASVLHEIDAVMQTQSTQEEGMLF